ncbi:YfcC family protein [Ornithinibacillus halotolerans]|uniref:C4-dicarboxylate ABC transporter n=1 Tax=Ornithinibacillus halotolerans TaxID=1274357 RepID=A0A916W918_9BACI|nr:YfcC family protein [Ornithinibacillus halotolerans]GGA78938.1 C4-dicarboxylate ABC transporter [Ornithinibacillus halotolerans]
MSNTSVKKQKKFEFPHGFVILFILMVLTAAVTYLVPAGQYERVTDANGRTLVVDGTYESIESNPTGLLDLFNALHTGMVDAAPIIFFIFIVGGSFGILQATNTIESAFGSLTKKLAGKEILLIPVVMLFLAVSGGTWGMAEEVIPFILIAIPLAIRMGFDSITGTAMILTGVYAGFGSAFMNPFTVGVAQGIAGLPTFSGMGVRFVFWFIFVGVTILYVMNYARKVKKNPKLSLMYEEDLKRETSIAKQQTLSKRQVAILIVLALTVIGLALGVILEGWYVTEIASLFLIMGIIVGFIAKMRMNQIAQAFVKGCEEMVMGALIVGFAYGILVILQDSNTIDTILFYVSSLVAELPTYLSAMGMYGVQSLLNFIVPSGSGQAAISMPILAPLGDLVGVSRQTAVLAFQYGDGISNILTPTAGVLMASLALAKIPWIKWVKWALPLILIQYALGAVFIMIAHLFIW